MDKKMHDKGLEVRKAVLGEAYHSGSTEASVPGRETPLFPHNTRT